jgi:hypothetical protein
VVLEAGGEGEVCVKSPGVMKGYYNNPEATAASFHGEWFRTGDLFRKDERGYFSIVGRVKDMIRRAGENVSARVAEEALRPQDERGCVEVAIGTAKHDVVQKERGGEARDHLGDGRTASVSADPVQPNSLPTEKAQPKQETGRHKSAPRAGLIPSPIFIQQNGDSPLAPFARSATTRTATDTVRKFKSHVIGR